MDLYIYVISFVILGWILNCWRIRRIACLAKRIPSNRLQTLLGLGPLLGAKSFLKYITQYGKKYGSNNIFWFGPYAFFLTYEPETIKDILNSKNCVNKAQILYDRLATIMGSGIVNNIEPHWSEHRKILNPGFSNKNLLSFLPIFNEELNTMIQKIDNNLNKEIQMDMLVILREFTLNNASQTILKRKLDLTKMNAGELSNEFTVVLKYAADVCFNCLLEIGPIRSLAENTLYTDAMLSIKRLKGYIFESIGICANKDTSKPSYLPDVNGVIECVLSSLTQDKLTKKEVEDEMINLFIGAFETTSTTLFFVIIMLAMHPEYQERAYDEISSVLTTDENRHLSMKDIEQLNYLDMFLNEVMRLFPVIPQVFRQVAGDNVTLSNGTTLQIGQVIAIDIHHLHRDKTIWGPDADRFNPDNFLPANVNLRHPYAYIPFTKGIRFCIGWRYAQIVAKMTIAKLLQSYKFSTDFKYENLVLENHLTLKAKDNPIVYIKRR